MAMHVSARRFDLVVSLFAMMVAGALLVGTPRAAPAQERGDARVGGVVRNSQTKAPIRGAKVAIISLHATATTDSLGRFELVGLVPGVRSLDVTAVGFHPLLAELQLSPGDSLQLAVTIDPVAQAIEGVKTRADAPRLSRAFLDGFDERRKSGIGHFFSQAQLDSASGRRLTDLVLGRFPGLRLYTPNGGTRRMLVSARNGDRNCFVMMVLDGAPIGAVSLDDFEVLQLEGVEYYTPAQTPNRFKFAGNTSCGTLVMWQRS